MSQEAPSVPEPPALVDEAFLQNVRVASPCSVDWETMPGGERVRDCARCGHRVYNLSAMHPADAVALLREAEGSRVCVRFYRRADGTVMTRDCPVGLRALRMRLAKTATLVFSSLFVALGMSMVNKPRDQQPSFVRWVLNSLSPEAPKPAPALMGEAMVIPVPLAKGSVQLLPMASAFSADESAPAPDKPYLEGVNVTNTPRTDPFAKKANTRP